MIDLHSDTIYRLCQSGSDIGLKAIYPWQGMVRKKYSDVYLTPIRDENGKVFAAQYGWKPDIPEDRTLCMMRRACPNMSLFPSESVEFLA